MQKYFIFIEMECAIFFNDINEKNLPKLVEPFRQNDFCIYEDICQCNSGLFYCIIRMHFSL